MDYSGYFKTVELPNDKEQIQEMDSSESSEEEKEELQFIIENKPSVRRVRKYFKSLLEYDDTPDFLK